MHKEMRNALSVEEIRLGSSLVGRLKAEAYPIYYVNRS